MHGTLLLTLGTTSERAAVFSMWGSASKPSLPYRRLGVSFSQGCRAEEAWRPKEWTHGSIVGSSMSRGREVFFCSCSACLRFSDDRDRRPHKLVVLGSKLSHPPKSLTGKRCEVIMV